MGGACVSKDAREEEVVAPRGNQSTGAISNASIKGGTRSRRMTEDGGDTHIEGNGDPSPSPGAASDRILSPFDHPQGDDALSEEDSLDYGDVFQIGQLVSAYEIVSPPICGDVGTTYFANQGVEKRALKYISFHHREHMVPLIRDDQRIVTRFQHSNVLHVYDVMEGPDHSSMIVVTEVAEYGNVFRLAGKLDDKPDILWKIVHDVGVGLRVLHSHHIYHHDLKLENILETKPDTFALGDGGFHRLFADIPVAMLVEMGQLSLIPPEIFTADRADLDAGKMDIWGFGIVMYHLAFGLNPFNVGGRTIEEVHRNILDAQLHLTKDCGLSHEFIEVLKLTMQKDPVQRPNINQLLKHPYFKFNNPVYRLGASASSVVGSTMAMASSHVSNARSFGGSAYLPRHNSGTTQRDQGFMPDEVLGKGPHAESMLVHLSTGGKYVTFKAFDHSLSSRLEECSKHGLKVDMDAVRRHIAVARKLKHPNVVGYLEVVDDKTVTSLTQKYISKGNLAENFPMFIDQEQGQVVKSMLWDVLNGLKALHDNGTYHCNLKPSNVFYGDDSNFVIADFGPVMNFVEEIVVGKDCTFDVPDDILEMLTAPEEVDSGLKAIDTFCVGLLAASVVPELRGTVFHAFYNKKKPGLDSDAMVSMLRGRADSYPEHFIPFVETALQACATVDQLLNMPLFTEASVPMMVAPATTVHIDDRDIRNAIKARFDFAEEHRLMDTIGPSVFAPVSPGNTQLEVGRSQSIANFGSHNHPPNSTLTMEDMTSRGVIELKFHDSITCELCKRRINMVLFYKDDGVRCPKCRDLPTTKELSCMVVAMIRGFEEEEEDTKTAVLLPLSELSARGLESVEMHEELPKDILHRYLEPTKSFGRIHHHGSSTPSEAGEPQRRGGLLSGEEIEEEFTVEDVLAECREGGTDLNLHKLNMQSIPPSIFDGSMAQVVVLDISNNNIKEIPREISRLCSLEHLKMSYNQLTELPKEIGDLAELQFLDVSHNMLTDLPFEMMFCDRLEQIVVDYNDLEAFPECMFELPNLRALMIAENRRINKWPPAESLRQMALTREVKIAVDNEPDLDAEYHRIKGGVGNITVQWHKIYPDLIIPNLYCGSLRSAQSPAVYERLNIKYLLTMGRGLEPVVTDSMKHKTVIVDDIEGATISNSFDEATVFIAEAMEKGVGCLVHCFAGMSRSATAVIVYLMLRHGMRLDEAYLLVKSGRPAIHPNDGFFKQMRELDTKTYPNNRPLDIVSLERDKIP